MKGFNFQIKFITHIIPLIVLLSFIYLGFYLYRSNRMLEKELIEKGNILAKALVYSSELGVLSQDRSLFESPFSGILKERDVVYATVYFANGGVFVSDKNVDVKVEGEISEDILKEILKAKVSLNRKVYTQDKKMIYDFYCPILATSLSTEEIVGIVRIGLSPERIRLESREVFTLGLWMTILVILLMDWGLYHRRARLFEEHRKPPRK